MKDSTRATVEALTVAAIADPEERAEVVAALRKKCERKDRWLTGREAARLAGVNRKTLLRWERRGYLHAKRTTPSRIRFSRCELETFLGETLEG